MENFKKLETEFLDLLYLKGVPKLESIGNMGTYETENLIFLDFTLEFFVITLSYSKYTQKLYHCDIRPVCWSKDRIKKRKFQMNKQD